MTDLDQAVEAAAQAYDAGINAELGNPPGFVLDGGRRHALVDHPAFRAAVTAAVAVSRAQVAEEIARAIERFRDGLEPVEAYEDEINALHDAARIAREHATQPTEESR